MLNTANNWAPVNGLCLSWPSAARLADKHDPYPFNGSVLLDNWEAALARTMQTNFWPSLGGGGLEQVGATQAVNELLLQSFEGFLRFFPGWPLGETARFSSLRAVGAFLVSATVDEFGMVENVTVVSEAGRDCTFLPFKDNQIVWNRGKQVKLSHPSCASGQRCVRFATIRGDRYLIE